ncbi:putative phenylalanine--tRNA ligase, mitochondrial, partial [Fragariocoptes setiger]
MTARLVKDFVEIFARRYPTDSLTNVTSRLLTLIGRKLHERHDNPINLVSQRIGHYFVDPSRNQVKSNTDIIRCRYDEFKYESPVVTTHDNFDSLLIPQNHVSRRPNDTYYVNKSHLLRSHTSAHQMHCLNKGSRSFVCVADCYRRDEIDSSHFPAFHQCEVFRLFHRADLPSGSNIYEQQSTAVENEHKQAVYSIESSKFVERQLKLTIEDFMKDLFHDPSLQMRWVSAYFPFTHPSFELEILWQNKWLEILGCGIVRDEILRNAGIDESIGFAAGFGLERMAMLKYKIHDIRLFWSLDSGFTHQFENKSPYDSITFKPFSQCPQCINDLSFWLPTDNVSFLPNDFYDLVRTIGGDLVEQVKLIDEYHNKKTGRTSNCFRIIYRSCDKVLTKEEVNVIHEKIAQECVDKYGVELR